MSRRSIVLIVPTLAVRGGSVRVACWMANELQRDNDVVLVSCESFEQPAFPLEPTVKLASLSISSMLRVRERAKLAVPALQRLFADAKPHLVFGIGVYETFYAIKPTRRAGAKLVFCDHGALINQIDDRRMCFMRWANSVASSRTVVLTRQSKDDYRRILHTPNSKLRVISNSVSTEFSRFSYEPSSKRIVWAGRLANEKGADHLLAIAGKVLPEHPDWAWDVYGSVADDLDFDPYERSVEFNCSETLVFHGPCSDMPSAYRGHSIGTLTSYREGLPLFLLECKAAGLPVVSFDVSTGPRDIISDGVDGFLIEPFDVDAYASKLGELMDSEDLRISMSKATKETLPRYSEEAIAKQWRQLINELSR